MKFKVTPYHFDLLKDTSRLSVFYDAIKEYDFNNQTAYDLGSGCGILSYFLSLFFNEVISIEIDEKTYNCACENLRNFNNITVINSDVCEYEFSKKADLIVCEMLDTALIDEEQIPILNYAKKFLKKNGKIIPEALINTAEIVNMQRHYIHWDENDKNEAFSNPVLYSKINFRDDINPNFKTSLKFESNKSGMINGLKITSYTILSENIIAGPLPMLNPPLLIPLSEKQINTNDIINVELKYIMGSGIESIKIKYL